MKTKITTLISILAIIFTLASQLNANASLTTSEKKTIAQMQQQIGILSARVGELERQLNSNGTYTVDTVNYISVTNCGTGLQVNQLNGSFSIGNTKFQICQFLYNYASK